MLPSWVNSVLVVDRPYYIIAVPRGPCHNCFVNNNVKYGSSHCSNEFVHTISMFYHVLSSLPRLVLYMQDGLNISLGRVLMHQMLSDDDFQFNSAPALSIGLFLQLSWMDSVMIFHLSQNRKCHHTS